MNFEQIMDVIRNLAQSQGFYGRILAHITEIRLENPEGYEELKTKLEKQNFKDAVDIVMYFET